MYLNILKRDLKRKKTMNIILLLFTILASIFVASGLSNVVTIMNGTDYFLDKAGIGDYVVITQNGNGGVLDLLKESKNVENYRMENCYWATKDNIKINNSSLKNENNTLVIQSIANKGIRYFLPDNSELTEINKGEIYVPASFLEKNAVKIGDKLQINLQDLNVEVTIAGEFKDALLGSDMMKSTRLIISEEDYKVFDQNEKMKPYQGCLYYIDTNNEKELTSELAQLSNILFNSGRSTIKLSYVMEMIVAMIVLVLSICLIIVAFVILKFVITFSIIEEFREIGVMKAIGIGNRKIRSLYIIKYFFIAIVGGIIGFIISIPFGSMLIKSVSQKMVLGNDSGIMLNIIGSLIVIGLMVGFTYLCTSKVKKFSPVDAIRNGETGERYKKKSLYSLSKAHTNPAMYMAINDVLSSPKRFITIILSFFLSSVFVFGLVLVVDTMKSKNLITVFGKESDIYITDSKIMNIELLGQEGNENLEEKYKEIEKDLADNGMPGQVSMEVWFKYNCYVDSKFYALTFQQNTKSKASDYEYIEGFAPEKVNEIAITPQISNKIGAKIGDIITIDFGVEKMDCMVVGYFQSMNQIGEVIRLHEDAPTSMEHAIAMMAFQIDFDDNPNEKEINKRIERIKELYAIEEVYDAAGYCTNTVGVIGTLEAVGLLLLIITCIVVVLVTVLMERSFISDETGKIALLKALGFKDRFILKWHIYRFMLVGILAEILAVALTVPITKLWCDPIWRMMGALKIKYCFNPLCLLVIYPGIILIITFAAVTITALYTKKISSRDMGNIE